VHRLCSLSGITRLGYLLLPLFDGISLYRLRLNHTMFRSCTVRPAPSLPPSLAPDASPPPWSRSPLGVRHRRARPCHSSCARSFLWWRWAGGGGAARDGAGPEEEEKRRVELGRRWRSSERLLGWRWVKEVLGTGRPVLASLPRPCPHPSPSWSPLPQPYSISRASSPQAALLYSSKNKYSN
jgi:hypothetical protein